LGDVLRNVILKRVWLGKDFAAEFLSNDLFIEQVLNAMGSDSLFRLYCKSAF
jgi:hypothetical protein